MAKRNQPEFDDIHVCGDDIHVCDSIHVCDDTGIDALEACPSGAVGDVIASDFDRNVFDFERNVFDNVVHLDSVDSKRNVFDIDVDDHVVNLDRVDSKRNVFDIDVDDHVVNFRGEASIEFENKESSFAASARSESYKSERPGFGSRRSIVRRSLYSHECVCQKAEATPRERQVIINQFLILLSSYLCPKINFTGFMGFYGYVTVKTWNGFTALW